MNMPSGAVVVVPITCRLAFSSSTVTPAIPLSAPSKSAVPVGVEPDAVL